MAFGLPSAEQMRDYLISQGVDPVVATERANVAARQNAAQAARTSALSLAAGAAPARAAGAAAVEAAPAVARSAMGVGERIAAAPRTMWEYLTTPAGVVRNPTTGARIPTRNVTTGRMERTPDYFLPGQRVAQGTAGGLALGAGTAGVGALTEQPTEAPRPIDPEIKTRDGWPIYFTGPQVDINDKRMGDYFNSTPAEVLGSRRATAFALDSANIPMPTNGSGRGAAPPSMADYLRDRAGAMEANAALDAARSRAAPAQQRAPIDLTSGQSAASPSILSRIFSGQDYQSNSRPVNEPMGGAPVNWGSSDSAADFFRADKALMAKRREEEGMKRGGAANAKPDSLHKALEIIHHLLTRSH